MSFFKSLFGHKPARSVNDEITTLGQDSNDGNPHNHQNQVSEPTQRDSSTPPSVTSLPILPLERRAEEVLVLLRKDPNSEQVFNECINIYNEMRHNPDVLKRITRPRTVGQSLCILLSYGRIIDIDERQLIASLSYYLLTKSIKEQGGTRELYRDRVLLMGGQEEPLNYTISLVLNKGLSMMNFSDAMEIRENQRAIYLMELYDMTYIGNETINSIPILKELRDKNMRMYVDGVFGNNNDISSIINKGEHVHDRVYDYLHAKFIEKEDFDL